VDVGDPGVEIAHSAEGLVHVAGVERRRESVLHSVGDLNGFVEVLAGNHDDDRTEDFFLRDAHAAADVAENRGFEEPAVPVVAAQAVTAAEQSRTLGLADADILLRGLYLLLVDQWTDVHR